MTLLMEMSLMAHQLVILNRILAPYIINYFLAGSRLYNKLTHPSPAGSHRNYPLYTPGGGDRRWGSLEEEGQQWVGSLMFVEVLCYYSGYSLGISQCHRAAD
jgi:hypothetical protein